MRVLYQDYLVPLGRMLFVEKEGNIKREQLVVEATGPCEIMEKDDCFVIRNADCCKNIMVTVKVREDGGLG